MHMASKYYFPSKYMGEGNGYCLIATNLVVHQRTRSTTPIAFKLLSYPGVSQFDIRILPVHSIQKSYLPKAELLLVGNVHGGEITRYFPQTNRLYSWHLCKCVPHAPIPQSCIVYESINKILARTKYAKMNIRR